MDPILEHHLQNLAEGKAVKDEDSGQTQTVFTTIVNIDGKETLIPTIWDGQKVSVPEAIKRAKASGKNWMTGEIQELEAYDRKLHEQFMNGPVQTPEEAASMLRLLREKVIF
jgi:hypothetical protein